jgi:hypothetical protein
MKVTVRDLKSSLKINLPKTRLLSHTNIKNWDVKKIKAIIGIFKKIKFEYKEYSQHFNTRAKNLDQWKKRTDYFSFWYSNGPGFECSVNGYTIT